MSKFLLLLRHPESTKNIENHFSSVTDCEKLTTQGVDQLNLIRDEIKSFTLRKSVKLKNIFAANSSRGEYSAKYLSNAFSCEFDLCDEFCSFKLGKNSGISELELKIKDPIFYSNLTLYRKGLFSSYDIEYNGAPKSLKTFENDIIVKLDSIIADLNDNELSVIIMHKSALTAYLISIARNYHNYPLDFYGYVDLPLASVSVVAINPEGGMKIVCVGEPPSILCTLSI